MSAHRRPALREQAPRPRRSISGRRRARSRPYRLLPIALGMAMLGFGAVAGPGVVSGRWTPGGDGQGRERITLAGLPANAPEQGLIYQDLEPAGPDSLCAGGYELDEETCTHGPDAAPPGLRVRRDVAPVTDPAPEPVAPKRESAQVPPDAEIVRDEGGSALTAGKPALVPDAAPAPPTS